MCDIYKVTFAHLFSVFLNTLQVGTLVTLTSVLLTDQATH